VRRGLNFTLTTTFGDLDLLGEITGGGAYEALVDHSTPVAAFGVEVRCLNLDVLIRTKRAAGGPRISTRSRSWRRCSRRGRGTDVSPHRPRPDRRSTPATTFGGTLG
jgi:hypothetical protein